LLRVVEGVLGTPLTARERRWFFAGLVRELCGARFAAEVRKIFLDPQWGTRVRLHRQALKLVRHPATAVPASSAVITYFLERLGAEMRTVGYADAEVPDPAQRGARGRAAPLPLDEPAPQTQGPHQDWLNRILQFPAALEALGKKVVGKEFPSGMTLRDLWGEVGRRAARKTRQDARGIQEREVRLGDLEQFAVRFAEPRPGDGMAAAA